MTLHLPLLSEEHKNTDLKEYKHPYVHSSMIHSIKSRKSDYISHQQVTG